MRKLFLVLLFIGTSVTAVQSEPSRRPITIRAIEGLQFDPPRAKMDPGQKVLFRFLNRDPNDQPHNLVIIKPKSLQAIQQASLVINAEAIERGYIPEHDAVLKATKLLTADQSQEFVFEAPKEVGVYYYVCTYPGHAAIMYGALYVGEKWGSIEKDQNIPQFARERLKRLSVTNAKVSRPSVRRLFMKDVGPAAIAVALENEMNYCWDAGNCRLRKVWSGDFYDLGDNSRSNGNRQASISGKLFWDGKGDENTFAIQTTDPKATPSFKGYRIVDGKPEFTYTIDGLKIKEYITSTPKGIVNRLTISQATAPVKVYATGSVTSNVGTRDGDFITVKPEDASKLELTILKN